MCKYRLHKFAVDRQRCALLGAVDAGLQFGQPVGVARRRCGKRNGAIGHEVEAVLREPFVGIGKPEPLLGSLSGYWSRRIDNTHRLVYAVDDADVTVIACKGHCDG